MNLSETLTKLRLRPDVIGSSVLWIHRSVKGADWYFVTSPKGRSFKGTLDFRNTGDVEIWDPVTGRTRPVASQQKNERTTIALDLPQAGSCFVVFYHNRAKVNSIKPLQTKIIAAIKIDAPWTLSFPEGWGAPQSIRVHELKPWKDLDMSPEAKAFSGMATYSTTFEIDPIQSSTHFSIDLGDVNMIAKVTLNGKYIGTVWSNPYQLDITNAVVQGTNSLKVEITSTWFNRLAYDAGLPEDKRKTWTISGPDKDSPLKNSGLLGPVTIIAEKER
jgi:hypothetical protein